MNDPTTHSQGCRPTCPLPRSMATGREVRRVDHPTVRLQMGTVGHQTTAGGTRQVGLSMNTTGDRRAVAVDHPMEATMAAGGTVTGLLPALTATPTTALSRKPTRGLWTRCLLHRSSLSGNYHPKSYHSLLKPARTLDRVGSRDRDKVLGGTQRQR